MNRLFVLMLTAIAALAAGATSCRKLVEPPPISIVVDEISSSEAVAAQDTANIYLYALPRTNPDSLMRALVDGGVPVVQGWDAIDYLCKDAIGPRFTVLLSRADSRMSSYNFAHGTARLACSTRLRRYTVK